MKTNTPTRRAPIFTHEGAKAQHINDELALRRSVMSCLLWENEYYESGVEISERIASLVPKVKPEAVARMAIEARSKMKLRHIPLFLCREMVRHPGHKALVAATLANVIQRADELSEFLAIYWRDKKDQPLAKQVKLGLAAAFTKFSAYDLAKYNRDGAVKLRDVLFLCHAKPNNEEQAATWKQLIDGTLAAPDTWEVALSSGADKKEAWTRLIAEKKIGALAFIRNFRNMREAGVPKNIAMDYAARLDTSRVLPFRFVAAARACPEWEDIAEPLLVRAASQNKLPGKTVVIVDVSGSMYGSGNISKRSDMTRVDAAGALAAICRETCAECSLYATAGNDYARVHATIPVPPRRGFSLVDLFSKRGFHSQIGGGGIFLTQMMNFVFEREHSADRVIVLTDEQDCDTKCNPSTANAFGRHNYIINVASSKNGIAYDKFTHIDGWSESILEYIRQSEASE